MILIEGPVLLLLELFIPNNSMGNNPGALINYGYISTPLRNPCQDHWQATLFVTEIPDPRTTANKFEELREKKSLLCEMRGIEDGEIGFGTKVSCGLFDQDNRVKNVYTWLGDSEYPRFCPFGSVPRRKRERMDIYINNIESFDIGDLAKFI